MRAQLRVAWFVLFGAPAAGLAADPARADRQGAPPAPDVRAILRAASDLALKQGEEERFWTDQALLKIGELQGRAGDFTGALRTLRRVNDVFRRKSGLSDLIQPLARAGRRGEAVEVSRLLGTEWSTPDRLHDAVQVPWIEHLIATGDLRAAAAAAEQVKTPGKRREGLQRLAVAYARAGENARAGNRFSEAVDVAISLNREWDRAEALWEIAEAQRDAGAVHAAATIIRRLADQADAFRDSSARVAALRECAALTARLGDRSAARDMFRRALDCSGSLDGSSRSGAVREIAEAQARVGFVDDAVKTALAIQQSESDSFADSDRERALLAAAIARVAAGDPDGAALTVRSITHFTQYRDDALAVVVRHHIGGGNLRAALTATEGFSNSSRKAATLLRTAAALARAGRRAAAADVVAEIRLTGKAALPPGIEAHVFRFGRPETWGILYESGNFFTVMSHRMNVRDATEVAREAMGLAQALGDRPGRSYAVLFNDICVAEVTETLARSHAASGDPHEALAWARQIGSGDRVPATDGQEVRWAVERRIYALVGVAGGILDRPGG
jgi:tetratricopeptide (TPR) repeat protein